MKKKLTPMKKADFTINLGICLETSKLDEVCDQFRGRGGGGGGVDLLFSLSTRSNTLLPQPRFLPHPTHSMFFLHNYYNEQGKGRGIKKGECLLDRKKIKFLSTCGVKIYILQVFRHFVFHLQYISEIFSSN